MYRLIPVATISGADLSLRFTDRHTAPGDYVSCLTLLDQLLTRRSDIEDR